MMKNAKKILLVVLAVVLILGGFWLYWEQELSLGDYLPQEDQYVVSLVGTVFEGHVVYTVDADASEKIIACLNHAKVNRGPQFASYHPDSFSVHIYLEEEHALFTVLVTEAGQIHVGERYFEGGEDLFLQLKAIAEKLPEAD